jgi:hypothetical protein
MRVRALAALVLLAVVASCVAPHSGRRCDGALPMRCITREVCVYVNARGCLVCRCEEPAFVPMGR